MERFFFCSERFSSWSRWSMNFSPLGSHSRGWTHFLFFFSVLLFGRSPSGGSLVFFPLSLRLLLHLFS